jgi:HEAT repeat protein
VTWFAVLLGLVALVLGGVRWWSGSKRPGVDGKSNPGGRAPAAQGTHGVPSPVNVGNGTLVAELRESYRPERLASRIRLQGELTERWEKAVPAAAEVVSEIVRRESPPEHRVFVAETFRNLAKMNRFAANDAADVAEAMLDVVSDGSDDPLVRGRMAMVLSTFDKSPEAVDAAARLLELPDDDAGNLAVNALRLTATDEAAAAIIGFVQQDLSALDKKPRTAAAAMTALIGYERANIVPIASAAAQESDSESLIRSSLRVLAHTPSSRAVVDAILAAAERPEAKPATDQGVTRRSAAIAALKRHREFVFNDGATSDWPNARRARQLIEGSP